MPWTSNVPYVERSVKRARRSFTGTRSSTVKLGPLSNSGATSSVARSTGGCSKPDWAPATTTVVDTTSAIASPLIESVGFTSPLRCGCAAAGLRERARAEDDEPFAVGGDRRGHPARLLGNCQGPPPSLHDQAAPAHARGSFVPGTARVRLLQKTILLSGAWK